MSVVTEDRHESRVIDMRARSASVTQDELSPSLIADLGRLLGEMLLEEFRSKNSAIETGLVEPPGGHGLTY